MSAPIKSNSMEPYRLAKKLRGLGRAEKQALLAITDAASMHDVECRKSKATIDRERGLAPRSFYNGVHGRRRKDGTMYFPGLLNRGIVFIKAGGYIKAGIPTTYGIDIAVLQALVNGTATSAQSSAQTSAQENGDLGTIESEPRHKIGPTSAQNGGDLGTGADKVPNEVPDKGTESRYPRERETPSHSKNPFSPYGSPESARSGSEENHKPGGQGTQEKTMLEQVLRRVKGVCARARFSKTSRVELERALIRLGRTSWDDLDYAVQQTARGCTDDVAFSMFGTTLAANLESDVLARKEAARKALEAKPWCERVGEFIKSSACNSLADVEAWLALNPDKEGIETLGNFYVCQALSHADSKPELLKEWKKWWADTRRKNETAN